MRVSIIAYKSDFNEFLRKNAGKFLFFCIIILISLVIAVKNGLQLEDFCGYFEKKNRIELQLIRGEKTIFSYLFAGLIEAIIIFALILACSYNDFTALFCPLVLIYKAYADIFIDVIIIRFLGFSAIIYFIFRLLALILYLFTYSCACCVVLNESNRGCYGWSEFNGVAKSLIPSAIATIILIIGESVAIGISLIFI